MIHRREIGKVLSHGLLFNVAGEKGSHRPNDSENNTSSARNPLNLDLNAFLWEKLKEYNPDPSRRVPWEDMIEYAKKNHLQEFALQGDQLRTPASYTEKDLMERYSSSRYQDGDSEADDSAEGELDNYVESKVDSFSGDSESGRGEVLKSAARRRAYPSSQIPKSSSKEDEILRRWIISRKSPFMFHLVTKPASQSNQLMKYNCYWC